LGGDLKAFYLRKYPQIGKKKAIVATLRKLIEVFHTMMRNGEMYRFSTDEIISSKREAYGLIYAQNPGERAKKKHSKKFLHSGAYGNHNLSGVKPACGGNQRTIYEEQ
jgi:hypothetical protein